MERLTIDEVIEHCKRHTEGMEKRNPRKLLEIWDMEDPAMKRYWEHRQVAKWLEELKAYKDAEEQGLLIRLPCRVGDAVYSVVKDGLLIVELEFSLDFYVRRKKDFGKTVFKTKEEAEQALAKMKGE